MIEKRTECIFSFEAKAPNGFERISKDLEISNLNLHTWKSGYNGKFIIRSKKPGIIELDMDSSDTEIMFGSGIISSEYDKAKKIIEKLSEIFKTHGYPHEIGVDNEIGSDTYNLSYKWEDITNKEDE